MLVVKKKIYLAAKHAKMDISYVRNALVLVLFGLENDTLVRYAISLCGENKYKGRKMFDLFHCVL